MRKMLENLRNIFFLSLIITSGATAMARAADPRFCEMQARDYANVMAPRTGAPALKQPPGLPIPNQRDERPEAMRMVPNQEVYRRAYDACMSRG